MIAGVLGELKSWWSAASLPINSSIVIICDVLFGIPKCRLFLGRYAEIPVDALLRGDDEVGVNKRSWRELWM